jgi:zinc transporter ZupT
MNNFNHDIFFSIFSINLIPIIIIFFLIPIKILRRDKSLLIIFLSFASGGLMADVFLRLLPNIINSINIQNESHVHHQHDNRVGLFILMGVFLSFIIEKFFRYFQSMFYIQRIFFKKFFPFVSEDDDEPSRNILAYLFLLVDILYHYTNSWNLSSMFSKKSTNSKIVYREII